MQVEHNEDDQAPLAQCPLVMGWVIKHLPSAKLTGLALSCACLTTHAIIPDNMNAASLTLLSLSLLLMMLPIEQDSLSWASHYRFC